MPATALVWFRNDLRIRDHEPFLEAARAADQLVAVYCLEPRQRRETRWGFRKMGAQRARFLLESLRDLRGSLQDHGSDLVVRSGEPADVIPALVRKAEAGAVHYFEEVGTEEREAEAAVRRAVEEETDAQVSAYWGKTLYHIDDLPFEKKRRMPDVYTPFRKQVEKRSSVREALPAPEVVPPLPEGIDAGAIPSLVDLGFEKGAGAPSMHGVLPFHGGEKRAHARMRQYIWEEDALRAYKKTRNGLLGADFSSKFSAWLARGCLSPRQIHEEVRRYEAERVSNESTYWLLFELIWRDFWVFIGWKYGDRLFYQSGPMQKAIDWVGDDVAFRRWTRGRTGIPFVDANMRELSQTGYLSNRGRQNVASMLAKSLGLDWRMGAAWFERQLVDYDVTSNWGNWAYSAGVGNDPRDRYFNIVKQAHKYDPDAEYVRYWLPELEGVGSAQHAHAPHRMSAAEQEAAGCIVGEDYPTPVVDLEETYERLRRR